MFDDHSRIYRQIAEQIKAGVLHAEQRVMSTNQYAARYRINPATAATAFRQLVGEGVIYKRRGVLGHALLWFAARDMPLRTRVA